MENKIKKNIIILVITLCIAAKVFAAETISISISCTIPAIPGVNAPIAKEATNPQDDENALKYPEESEMPPEIENKTTAQPNAKKDNKPSPFLLSEKKTPLQVVKTIYSR